MRNIDAQTKAAKNKYYLDTKRKTKFEFIEGLNAQQHAAFQQWHTQAQAKFSQV